MRLISQNGWGYVDVEYENGTISMHDESEGTRIIYSWDNNSEESAIMAKYSSREKAEKVLEDMTKMYGSYISCNGGSGILQDPTLQRAVAIAQEIHSPGFSLSYLQKYIREWERVTAMFRVERRSWIWKKERWSG